MYQVGKIFKLFLNEKFNSLLDFDINVFSYDVNLKKMQSDELKHSLKKKDYSKVIIGLLETYKSLNKIDKKTLNNYLYARVSQLLKEKRTTSAFEYIIYNDDFVKNQELIKNIFVQWLNREEDRDVELTDILRQITFKKLESCNEINYAIAKLVQSGSSIIKGSIRPQVAVFVFERTNNKGINIDKNDQFFSIQRKAIDKYNNDLENLKLAAKAFCKETQLSFRSFHNQAQDLIKYTKAFRCYAFPHLYNTHIFPFIDAARIIARGRMQFEDIERLKKLTIEIQRNIFYEPSFLGCCIIFPICDKINFLINQISEKLKANIIIGKPIKRVPLHKKGQKFKIKIPMWNKGKSPASNIEINIPDSKSKKVESKIMVYPDSLPELHSVEKYIVLEIKPLLALKENIKIKLNISWNNLIGERETKHISLLIERQEWTENINWKELSPPYPLSWFSEKNKLRGRKKILNRLLNAVGNKELIRLYGEKRVGKTSIARVMESIYLDVNSYPSYLPVYIEWGTINKDTAGEVGHSFCQAGYYAFQKKFHKTTSVNIPTIQEFSKQFGLTALFYDSLITIENLERVILLLDDCEYISEVPFRNSEYWKLFIQSLKALANTRNIVILMFGSEKFRNLFELEMSSVVNIGGVAEIGYVEDPEGQKELICDPAKGILLFQDKAFDEIVLMSAGNPWFVNKICKEIFEQMKAREDGNVSLDDVNEVIEKLSMDEGQRGHFAHLWEETMPIDADISRDEFVKVASFVLSIISKFKIRPTNFIEEEKIINECLINSIPKSQTKCVLMSLAQRGVLVQIEQNNEPCYKIRAGLVHQWLRNAGAKEIRKEFHGLEELYRDENLLITDSEILEIEKLGWRRLDDLPIDSIKIKAWLNNFKSLEEQRMVFKLLQSIKYFDNGTVRNLLKNMYNEVSNDLSTKGVKLLDTPKYDQSKVATSYKDGYKKFSSSKRKKIANLFVTYGDKPPKSGALMIRFLNQALGGNLYSGDLVSLENYIRSHVIKNNIKNVGVIICNDLIGTGSSAKDEIKSFINRYKNYMNIKFHFYYIAVVGYQKAIEELESEFPQIKIFVAEPLLESDRAFSEESLIFDSIKEREKCRKLCEQIGKELVGERFKLGINSCQALVIFQHSVPNDTLPIFWSNGTVKGKDWVPLFNREA